MKAILTSSLGGYSKRNGRRVPSRLIEKNGLLDHLKSIWPQNASVLIISGTPRDYEKNDDIYDCLKEALPLSGLSVRHIDKCDDRNADIIEHLTDVDVLILAGGHVPTQNRFMHTLHLRERLSDYQGIIVAWSAGSMNCADMVYAGPELEGEAVNPLYKRWITGLGITDINIFPHFQSLKDEYLDGMRLIEDITFADSFRHEIIALNDGSYILLDDGRATVYGVAFSIKDGQQRQICQDGEFLLLE